MQRPIELATDAPHLWSPGTGTQVWNFFTATIAGDLAAIASLLDAEPALVRAQHAYVTPLYFAVRENQLDAARLLLDRGANALCFTVHNTHLDIARDRGYAGMEALLTRHLASVMNASEKGNAVTAAIRAYDSAEVRLLLDANPALLHMGDLSSSQPIHWAVMTRQLELIDELLARGADLNVPRASDQARPLHLTNGDLVPFTESYRLCGQCHGDKLRDWRGGVHGKRIGNWDGQKTYFLCVNCHNPHTPLFKGVKEEMVNGKLLVMPTLERIKPDPRPKRPDEVRP